VKVITVSKGTANNCVCVCVVVVVVVGGGGAGKVNQWISEEEEKEEECLFEKVVGNYF
jgi:hypothetical protein